MALLTGNPAAVAAEPEIIITGGHLSLTVRPRPGEGLAALAHRLAAPLRAHDAAPLHLLVFGRTGASAAMNEAFSQEFGRIDWPITWVEGAACDNRPIAGLQVHAFTGEVEKLEFGGRVVGSIFTEGGARQCLLGGLTSRDKTGSPADQTRQTLEIAQSLLTQAGFEFGDTVRTWFFLRNILSWYDEFNRARTQVYAGVKFRTGSLPASTGVGGKNPAGTALALALWAFRPQDKRARASEVASPLQCPAPAYGSSFSRAMEMVSASGRRLFISGTASIAPGGKTLWTGDVRRQVELSMAVVSAIVRSRGLTLADLTRATAYFRNPDDAPVFGEWLAVNGLARLPVVVANCEVCREDLLFELEAEV